jgi:hypothetical protein
MNAKLIAPALGLCLVTGLLAASGTTGRSWFVAHTSGAEALTLSGSAEFGTVALAGRAAPFVLTMGARAASGAVILTWANGRRPEPGVYALSQGDSAGVRALVVTGPPTRSTGAYQAHEGTVVVTRSTDQVVQGRFSLETVGFSAANPAVENLPLTVEGAFNARTTEP